MSNNSVLKAYITERKSFYSEKAKAGGVIRARDAFFGGRTNCIAHYAKTDEHTSLHYVDFKSLYPYVLKNRYFPIGHPRVIQENFDYNLSYYFGLIKCSILAPNDLYLPVLPMRVNKKLVFPLCNACAHEMNQSSCKHEEQKRILTGTWTTEEVKEAINEENGYVIKQIYEVWHFDQSSNTLFEEYVNTFLKLKQENEGFPGYIESEEEKVEYIEQFKEVEGVLLNYESIASNPSKRSIAKLLLNSLWGKFGQRYNLPKTKVCRDYRSRWQLLNDDKLEILADTALTPQVAIVNYKESDETQVKPGNTSIVLASFVSSYARLKLYNVLKQLKTRVLYLDTDSIIYTIGPNERKLSCGAYLGDLVDEIETKYGYGSQITEYASLGPKTYCLNIKKSDGSCDSIIRTKGITLNRGTLKLINVKSMVAMAQQFVTGQRTVLRVPQLVFQCTKTRDMYTEYIKKQFKAVSDKRRLCSNGITLPFGYK